MALFTLPVLAQGTLTLSSNALNTETVTIGGKVYTLQSTLTDSDGNVKLGATAEATIDNLVAAINLGSGAGTAYAASMTLNKHVRALKASTSTMKVYAKVAGESGNYIPTTETIVTGGSWGAATLTSGTGDPGAAIRDILASEQVSAGVAQWLTEVIQSEVTT